MNGNPRASLLDKNDSYDALMFPLFHLQVAQGHLTASLLLQPALGCYER